MKLKKTAANAAFKWRSLGLALVVTPFVFASAFSSAPALAARANSTRIASPTRSSNCVPKPGSLAYRQLTSPTSFMAPPAPLPIRRAGFFVDEEYGGPSSQWCWGIGCEHNEMACSLGYADAVTPCCVRCCWNPTNCSAAACCTAKSKGPGDILD